MVGTFTTKELAICALFGSMVFVVGYVLGTIVISMTGIPFTGGILNILVAAIIFFSGIRLLNEKFGVGALMFTIVSIIAIPTTIVGPPGVAKVAVGFLSGLVFDLVLRVAPKSKYRFALSSSLGVLASFFLSLCLMLYILHLPSAEQLLSMAYVLVPLYAVLGALGGHLGSWLYESKLKTRAFFRAIK
ncbi:MAG: hypothetical protein JW727_05495 [Candidatus Aenigmarchaeota archaeon]|nr:hypothetical protein [Candidatus Aenigmarchaeota archaeon]